MNSDTPREAPPADLAAGSGAAQGEGPATVLSTSDLHKVSSPELASLAAKYVNLSEEDVHHEASQHGDMSSFAADVRRLAASVLSQAEGGAK